MTQAAQARTRVIDSQIHAETSKIQTKEACSGRPGQEDRRAGWENEKKLRSRKEPKETGRNGLRWSFPLGVLAFVVLVCRFSFFWFGSPPLWNFWAEVGVEPGLAECASVVLVCLYMSLRGSGWGQTSEQIY